MRITTLTSLALPLLLAIAVFGCEAPEPTLEEQATLGVKRLVEDDLGRLHQAAVDLRDAAPEPDADGWNATHDADAVALMRGHWGEARSAYEHIEGAIAVLFPDLDAATDERYDGFLEEGPDDEPFDGEGVTGVHAVERILWADAHPAATVAFESALPGYRPAAYPATADEAAGFRAGLVQRLVDDTAQMQSSFEPLALDPAAAYSGVVGSMAEQFEKTQLAATGEDESRYAEHTLADMRANLEGGRALYEAFEPWLRAQPGGDAVHDEVIAGFERVAAAYATLPGNGVPPVPAGWSAQPDEALRATPYGKLYAVLEREADPGSEGSLVHAMLEAAALMDIPVAP